MDAHATVQQRPVRVAVLASGAGTTFAALTDAFPGPDRLAEVTLLIASRAEIPVLTLAIDRGIDHTIADAHRVGAEQSDEIMLDALERHDVDLIVLAGYLQKVGPKTLAAFAGRIINTHPAPLPRFGGRGMYGEHVHRAVLESGVAMSAVTIHLVDAEYDTGPVIAQRPVPINHDDDVTSLKTRVQSAERELLIETISSWTPGSPTTPG